MKKLILILLSNLVLTLAISLNIYADIIKTENFETAKKESQFLKFTGTSTKFGFVSTDFDGYAKEFTVISNIDSTSVPHRLTNVKIDIIAASLDTDISSRNDKLHKKCLNIETYKNIVAELTEPVLLVENTDQKTNLKLTIRNTTLNIPTTYSIRKIDTGYEIEFSTQFSFKDAQIPDPSIAIAKLDDIIKISGKIRI